MTKRTLVSALDLQEDVNFYPRFKDADRIGIKAETPLRGKIIAIRFTESKVFYDVVDNYWGELFRDIPSEKVFTETLSDKLNE